MTIQRIPSTNGQDSLPHQPNTKGFNVHFPEGQDSGSHLPPSAFQIPRDNTFGVPFVISQARNYIIRPTIPFDHWYYKNKSDEPLVTSQELWSARFTAIITLGKGLYHSLLVTIRCIFTYIFNHPEAKFWPKELKNQGHGVMLSCIAILSPNTAKEKFGDYCDSVNPTRQLDRSSNTFIPISL